MTGEEDFHVDSTEETERSINDICVLLLNSDDTCLMNLSKMMYECGYRVLTTTRADDLLHIINSKDEKIDLVVAEFNLIEMNKYELLEKIKSSCEIPVVVVGADVKRAVILECLCRGVKFYLKKPIIEGFLENLWQFTARRQGDFDSKIATNPPEKEYSITHTQFLVDEFNRTKKNNKVKAKDHGEYVGENFESKHQKKPDLIYPEMQKEFRQRDDELRHGSRRKERAVRDTGSDLGDQKKPKLIRADDLQCRTSEAIPDIEEATNGRKDPSKTKKNGKPVKYVFDERDFQPLKSVGKHMGHHEIPLSPRESSNRDVVGRLQMKKTDKKLMQDGIGLSDLKFDLQEVKSSASDLLKKAYKEIFGESFTDSEGS